LQTFHHSHSDSDDCALIATLVAAFVTALKATLLASHLKADVTTIVSAVS
jgi:hypothetical protein